MTESFRILFFLNQNELKVGPIYSAQSLSDVFFWYKENRSGSWDLCGVA